ncbi:MAG: hypothetical protein WC523_04680 [Patescibacteria group bacterium]
MNERLIHLRIKIKSLAAEAAIIRKEANKTNGMIKWGLNYHRTTVVREHARLNQLVYGLLRRVPYKAMETKCYKAPDFKKILELAARFGENDKAYMELWEKEAKAHVEEQNKV